MPIPEIEILTSLVSRILPVEDMTHGDPQKGFLVRFRGQLLDEDSASAYDLLEDLLKPYSLMPLFRLEQEKMAVIIQRMVGAQHGTRFYPDFAGVAKS